jgi:hypothetical protein
MHFTFTTTQYTNVTGNTLQLRLYDVSEEIIGRIQGEFTDIILNAGYEENPPTLFEGTVVQVRRGWEGDKADRYIDISAMDGDPSLSYAIIKDAVPNGSTYQQRWAAIANALKLPIDQMPDASQLPKELTSKQPRGKTLFGKAADAAQDQAMHMMCNWSIQRGKIVIVPYNGYAPNEPVEINGANGMIGWPEQTDEGIHVQTLLDARLFCHQLVKLNNADTLQQQLDMSLEYPGKNLPGSPEGRTIIPLDGVYAIVEVTHSGDTRGNEWYSDLLCLSTDPNQIAQENVYSNGWR